jgi:hypothetical protein
LASVVVREENSGFLCIPQSQHAAISGQIARAWGNDAFPPPAPRPEVCLAAARHDDGMDDFDRRPELDPETGLPRSFMRMPLGTWLECWRRGPSLVATDSPYAGVLVSLHGTGLLAYRRIPEEDAEERGLADGYRAEQERLRAGWIERCRDDPETSPYVEEVSLERNRRLLALWDAMSLAVCMPRLPGRFERVPAATEEGAVLELEEVGEPETGAVTVSVDPWPFSAPEVPLAASGRPLAAGFDDEGRMRDALAAAAPRSLSATLIPI